MTHVYRDPSLALIIDAVSAVTGVPKSELLSAQRHQHLCEAREVIYFLAVRMTRKTFAQIGRAVGDRDHTTVLNGYSNAKERFYFDAAHRERMLTLEIAVQTIAASTLAPLFNEPDMAALLDQVRKAPKEAALRITADELSAIASRAHALTVICQFVARELRALRSRPPIGDGARSAAYARMINQLEDLGFTENDHDEAKDQDAGRECARAAN